MKKEDFETFLDIMDKTAVGKRTEVTRECVGIWFDDLAEFDIDVLEKAFKEVRGARWGFPDIADIRRAAVEIQKDKAWVYTQEYLEDQARIQRIGAKEHAEFDKLIGGNFKRLRGEAK